MFGLGFQELLLVVLIVGIMFFVGPGIFHLVLRAGLAILKAPIRVLVALWIVQTVFVTLKETRPNMLASEFVIAVMVIAVLTIPQVALQFVWLWIAGSVVRFVGLTRLGTAWRDMASLFWQSLRRRRTTETN